MESEGGSSRSKKSVRAGASENTGSSYAPFDSKCRDDRDGVAPKCYCGGYAIRYLSRTRNNPNRLFFGCPFYKQPGTPYCSYFMWLDKHLTKLGNVKDVKDGEGADDVEEHDALFKVIERVAMLENMVAAMEKLRNVKKWIVLSSVVALLFAAYVVGS
ncbi:hypothetical protein PIB30_036510 [Stylosanthes scabra]|uniref:GRF-type domain-containing protein n=1 Tax=Stylosanthes scabra TaxID=79078 RepID=A0ABU6QCW7_9FABA|nr:hypothetical protein [Stylosanthes scabra]